MTDRNDKFNREEEKALPGGVLPLVDAPLNLPLELVEITGGLTVKKRLLSMGFNRGDLIELDVQAIMNGPLVVRNIRLGTRVALGRGVAGKILVARITDGKK